MTISIAHLSDPHITTGMLAAEPAMGLSRALGRALALEPQPDCVVITGDLINSGRPEEYPALLEVIGRYPLPVYLVAGNHDNPEALVDACRGTNMLGGSNQAHYSVDHPAFTIIVLNSHVPDSPGGRVGESQLEWLDEILAHRPDIPAFVCVHHPPMPIGIPFLDALRLADGDALAKVLVRHTNVARVLSGHVHRSITSGFAGSTLAIAPSTYLQAGLALEEGAIPHYFPEPTSFLLHLQVDDAWITHTVAVSHAAAPIAGYGY